MMYFQKLVNLASYPTKSPCVLFSIVQKNLFLSPLCYHQIQLSSQMHGQSRRPLADCRARTDMGLSVCRPPWAQVLVGRRPARGAGHQREAAPGKWLSKFVAGAVT